MKGSQSGADLRTRIAWIASSRWRTTSTSATSPSVLRSISALAGWSERPRKLRRRGRKERVGDREPERRRWWGEEQGSRNRAWEVRIRARDCIRAIKCLPDERDGDGMIVIPATSHVFARDTSRTGIRIDFARFH